MTNEYVVYKSENNTINCAREYRDDWYRGVEDPTVPVGFRILVVDSNNGNKLQRDITEHQGNNHWIRMCFLYTKDDPIPEFHRNGRLWTNRQCAAIKGNQRRFTSAQNYANRKFTNCSSLSVYLEIEDKEMYVPGKVDWVYDKPEQIEESYNPPSLIPYDEQPLGILDLLTDEEKSELPMFEVQHGSRTRLYRVDEPIAFTPGIISAEDKKYYDKIRENLILQYFNSRDKL